MVERSTSTINTGTPTSGARHTPSGRTLRLPPGSRNSVSVDQERTVPTPPAAPGPQPAARSPQPAAPENEREHGLVHCHRMLRT
ncbi:hypothetical protein ACFVVU_36020 [Kitasatospora sp. NPDC057965]|uniref:hypothetical protein n=1 Tax=Kitasatospora sp. NPDC057965 TaxID=3346291 RepID=UPI0036DA29F0